jgi:isocitrate dehydrogenase (NAD+)
MMEDEAGAVARGYPGIALWSTNIDAQTMWLTKNPENYGVVVASNLYGDVISDAFAGLIAGLGFAASGNIGDEVAVFEPTHGSAPEYAELDPPIVVKEGKVRTYDMMRIQCGGQFIEQRAASTVQMTDAVLAKLAEQPRSEGPLRERMELADVGHT